MVAPNFTESGGIVRTFSWLFPATFALALVPLPTLAAPAASSLFQAHALGRASAVATIPFVIHLPLRNEAELEQIVALQGTPGTQAYHRWLTPAQFRARYGATPAQLTVASNALRAAGVSIDRVSSQFITAHSSAAVIERAFGAQMTGFRGPNGNVRIGSRVALTLPPALQALNADVEGLVYHGEGHPMLRTGALTEPQPLNRAGLLGPLWFDDIKQAYRYPAYQVANGSGVRVATVNEADFSSPDLIAYLQHEKIGEASGDLAPLPSFSHFRVPGARGFDVNDAASQEANLDTQQVTGSAPGATLTGYTTNAFDFPTDFLQVYDFINETNSEDIVSTSYGECELVFTAGYNGGQDFTGVLRALHDTFLQGNSEGITYLFSSGDEAGRPCPELAYFTNAFAGKTYSTVPSVNIPASDPNVVAVGGGNLITASDPDNPKDLNSAYITENAYADAEPPADIFMLGNNVKNRWWGAGGGQSAVWGKPSWQTGLTPGISRSVPDVGLFVGGCFPNDPRFVQPCADDVSHATFELGGKLLGVIGTSVAAPEAAGLLATVEDYQGSGKVPGSGRLGNVNALLYHEPAAYFHQSIPGFNGVIAFKGDHTWNPSYGLGSLFNHSPFSASAGIPQTPTNP